MTVLDSVTDNTLDSVMDNTGAPMVSSTKRATAAVVAAGLVTSALGSWCFLWGVAVGLVVVPG